MTDSVLGQLPNDPFQRVAVFADRRHDASCGHVFPLEQFVRRHLHRQRATTSSPQSSPLLCPVCQCSILRIVSPPPLPATITNDDNTDSKEQLLDNNSIRWVTIKYGKILFQIGCQESLHIQQPPLLVAATLWMLRFVVPQTTTTNDDDVLIRRIQCVTQLQLETLQLVHAGKVLFPIRKERRRQLSAPQSLSQWIHNNNSYNNNNNDKSKQRFLLALGTPVGENLDDRHKHHEKSHNGWEWWGWPVAAVSWMWNTVWNTMWIILRTGQQRLPSSSR